MIECPDFLDNACVLCYTPLDARHSKTGNAKHYVGGELQHTFCGLAIATYGKDESCYLFYCDSSWEVENDTLHSSLADAKAQAEFEYSGVSETWVEKAQS
jgi:hypothetical protein